MLELIAPHFSHNILIIFRHCPALPPYKGLVISYSGEAQRTRRRFAMAALRNLGMGQFRIEERMIHEINLLTERFKSYNGKPFSPFLLLESAFSNVLCSLVFGKRYDYDDPTLKGFLHLLNKVLKHGVQAGVVNFLPFLKYIPFTGARKLQNIPEWRQFFEDIVSENAEDYIPNQPRNFIDMYLDHQESMKIQDPDLAKAFDHDDLIRCLGDLFAAGTETSANTTKWALQYMMMNPKIQTRVQDELDSVIGHDRVVSIKDRPNLPYTEATLMEVHRMSSIVPLGLPHAAKVDTSLNGYDIPKGTVVMSNIWAVHHDPKIWDNPGQFRPERFLDNEGGLQRREELIPFSIGKNFVTKTSHTSGQIWE